MARLSLFLLGAFQATLDGKPVTAFGSIKARALLAYLAVESDRPHRREKLAALLWPERPDQVARANLRRTLSSLRRVIGDRGAAVPFLLVTRETVQFNHASDYWLDMREFQAQLDRGGEELATGRGLADAVSLYRGTFLEGFSVRGSPTFEDWAAVVEHRSQRQASAAIRGLVEDLMSRYQLDPALEFTWRWVELEPWQEQAHQQLMTALALSGQRTAALAQFEACKTALREELAVDPSQATVTLYEQIRDGAIPTTIPAAIADTHSLGRPRFQVGGRSEDVGDTAFVARDEELAALDAHHRRALEGHGHVVFVTGEAGEGKTALVRAFADRAQATWPSLVVASGNCNAYTGIGDPYLPFREILEMLTADVEAEVAAGAIALDHAQRLRDALPVTARALVAEGPDLVGVFLPGAPLARRATASASTDRHWIGRLTNLVDRETSAGEARGARQDDLFEQYATVLKSVARHVPLLLLLDDLQWTDVGSAGLLFHLGRRLADSRILIVAMYRSEEVALGRDGERHPLSTLLHEFTRSWGDIQIDLAQAEGRLFTEALLDSAQNAFSAQFRETLYKLARGHALFTVELLKGMRERGDLVLDAEGRWAEGPQLDWGVLPARIEALIAERIAHLHQPLKDVLRYACVEGEEFTAEVLARAQGTDERRVVASLSGELERKHKLVRARGIEQVAGQRISRYRFRHILFQRYLYSTLDPVERAHLHGHIGDALKALHSERVDETAHIAPSLALHYELAGMPEKAIAHYQQAGERAVRMSANAEAIEHLGKGLKLLNGLPDTPQRAQMELHLQLAVVAPMVATASWGAEEAGKAYARALQLSEAVGGARQVPLALCMSASYHTVRAHHRVARALTERALDLAARMKNPTHLLLANGQAGAALLFPGEFKCSQHHFEQALALYEPELHHALAFTVGQDPAVVAMSFSLYCLHFLGYPDQAVRRSVEVIALAQKLEHPLTTVFALAFSGRLHRWRHEPGESDRLARAVLEVSETHGIALGEVCGLIEGAWVLSARGRHEDGIAQLRRGLEDWSATGMANHIPEFLAVLAEMYGMAGHYAAALSTLDEAFAEMGRTGERYYEAELHRLRGELLLAGGHGSEQAAGTCFLEAIDVARRQSAKMLELRSATSLARLWQTRGREVEAREFLEPVYDWFTEGFDTADLNEAKHLLDALA
jgi:DNA-binding SARP family transcriptional activator/predicted ATPase